MAKLSWYSSVDLRHKFTSLMKKKFKKVTFLETENRRIHGLTFDPTNKKEKPQSTKMAPTYLNDSIINQISDFSVSLLLCINSTVISLYFLASKVPSYVNIIIQRFKLNDLSGL